MKLAQRTTPSLGMTLSRIAWLLMLVGHIPATLAAFGRAAIDPAAADWVRLGLLGATQLFCVLKVADVAWLRFPHSTAFWLRFAIIVALLHSGVIWNAEPAVIDQLVALATDAIPALVVLALAAVAIQRILRANDRLEGVHTARTRRRLSSGDAIARLVSLRTLLDRLRALPDRAPPSALAL